MKLNKLTAGALMALGMGTSAFAMTYDFNIGMGGGFNSGSLLTQFDQDTMNNTNMITWLAGGFLGGGVAFDKEDGFTQSMGLEYSVYYKGDYMNITASSQSAMLGFLEQNMDAYYKISMMKGMIPMDMQFNVGLATRLLVNNDIALDSLYGFGIHTGVRFNIHMFFLSTTYTYMPSMMLSPSNAPNPTNYYGLNDHSVGVTVGVMFNKGILDALMGK